MNERKFEEFEKIPRLNRECIITEKIDGTNTSIFIPEIPEDMGDSKLPFLVGSRTRWITPEKDNHGFARWAYEHQEAVLKLGPGIHYGEWWGLGIQRGYGLKEKRFSLFNCGRWIPPGMDKFAGQEHPPEGIHVVPVIMRGPFGTDIWNGALKTLEVNGSFASPGFMSPEGIVVFHTAGRILFKATLEDDESPKSTVVAPNP